MAFNLISRVLLLAVLLGFSAFFSGAETAIFSLSNLAKKRLKTRHPRPWKTIQALLEKPRRTLITILIGNMIVNTFAIALATSMALQGLGPKGVGWSIPIFTFVLLLTGEITPKTFAVKHNELLAFLLAGPLDLFARFFYPLRRLVRWSSDFVLSALVRERKIDADLVSEVELKALARIGEEEGALRPEERRMIQKLIGLGDRIAREVMTPRPDLIAFDVSHGSERLVQLLRQHHFSHMPVYRESIDRLLGVISTQDFMLNSSQALERFILPPFYIPETKPVDELFEEFQKRGVRFAICVDEHGATAGLVTLEDILEEVFGEFYDEYTQEEALVKSVASGVYLVHGKIGLHQLKEFVGISLKSETSETLNGWLLEQLGRIPNINESFRWEGLEFHIKEVHHQRILKVEIRTKK